MKKVTLEQLLRTQDMGQKAIDKITDAILNNQFNSGADPVTNIIVDAFGEGTKEPEDVYNDIQYAIDQLRRAQHELSKHLVS